MKPTIVNEIAPGMLGNMAGVRIFKSFAVPCHIQVRRTWRERLTTWPWKPWQKFKLVPVAGYKIADDMIAMNPRAYDELMREARNGQR